MEDKYGNAISQKISYGNVDWGIANLNGGFAALTNLVSYVGLYFNRDILSTSSKIGIRFLENIGPSSVGLGATVGGIAAYNIAKDHGAEGWELFGWTMAGIVGGGVIGGALGAGVGALVTQATGVIGLSITKYSILTIKGTTVLGNMPGYIAAAEATRSGYYLVSNGTYEKMVEKGVEWVNNMTYIKDAHTLGSKFALVPNYVAQQGRTFWQEIQYLIENGIPWELC